MPPVVSIVGKSKSRKTTLIEKIVRERKREFDGRAEEYNLQGRSIPELPDDSPASLSIKKI
jgi:hypothetical protein